MQNGGKIIKIVNTGYCICREKIAYRSGFWKQVKFHAYVYLIKTDRGNILVDTGYAKRNEECKKAYPNCLFNAILPVTVEKQRTLIEALNEEKIALKDISYVFVTHFHLDHILGLNELKDIPWIVRVDAWEKFKDMKPFEALKHGVFHNILPKSFPEGSILVRKEDFRKPFRGSSLRSFRPFSDSKIELVDLPGHALGQMGLSSDKYFFIADAVWSLESLEKSILPNLLGMFIQQDKKRYVETFHALYDLKKTDPNLEFIPSHVKERL